MAEQTNNNKDIGGRFAVSLLLPLPTIGVPFIWDASSGGNLARKLLHELYVFSRDQLQGFDLLEPWQGKLLAGVLLSLLCTTVLSAAICLSGRTRAIMLLVLVLAGAGGIATLIMMNGWLVMKQG